MVDSETRFLEERSDIPRPAAAFQGAAGAEAMVSVPDVRASAVAAEYIPDEDYTVIDANSPLEERRKLQTDLQRAGENIGPSGADGIIGARTIAAIESFQSKNGLEVNGVAGQETLSVLQERVGHLDRLEQTIRNMVIEQARVYVGVAEEGGNNRGDEVGRFLRAAEYTTDNGLAAPQGSNWCAGFASTVLDESVPGTAPFSVLAKGMMRDAQAIGAFHSPRSGYTPQPGDLVFFERGVTGDWRGHVGFVESVAEDGSVTTIEGNKRDEGLGGWQEDNPDAVRRITYSPSELSGARLLGYGDTAAMYFARQGPVDPGLQLAISP